MITTRRSFLEAGVAAGLSLAFDLPEQLTGQASTFEPNAYLRITADNEITLWVARLEMGQGVRTLMPMLIAEELEVEWSAIRVEQASPGGKFKNIQLHTSGSDSAASSYRSLRTAGAAARDMLIAAAAAVWHVAPEECRAERGTVVHVPSGRRQMYGQLASAASQFPVPQAPALKAPSAFRLVGTPTKRIDGPAIVTGKAAYGADVRVPGMLFAVIERAPSLGATVAGFDGSEALRITGVRHVVPVVQGIHQGVAVVADDTWSAIRGREKLRVQWHEGQYADFDSDRFLQSLPDACSRATFRVRHEGDALGTLASAPRRHEATYVFPFQAHAPLETMNCTADVRADSVELWVPTQTDVRTLAQASRIAGLPEDRIHVHCTLMGGGFGRRLFADFVAEAVEISKAIGTPVQVLWTRQDDTRFGYFQPATAQRFTAGLDARGTIMALVHKTTASDLTIYDIHAGRNIWTRASRPERAADSYEQDQSPWGAYDNPYEISHLRVDCADVTSPVPTGPWRAVEYPSTVFGRESFLDELAHLAGVDPIAYRLAMLPAGVKRVGPYSIDRGRLAQVLRTVAERSNWTTAMPDDAERFRGRGVAANVYHAGSYVAMAAEVSVASDLSDVRVHRIVTAVDCGIALNPLGVEGQTESGIAWGLSATLFGKIDFKNGRAVQSSYRDFEVLRIDRMPALETVIVNSGAAPGGFGEHPVPLVAPAVANAVFAATKRRVRSLPITPAALRSA